MQEIKKINLSLEWKYEKLGKLCSFDKEGVNPKEDIKYYHYSFPAFDNNKEPEVEVGKDIKSSKFLFNKGDILFNKLNVKFKRVWDIDFDIDENSICSTEFIPIQAKNIDRNFLYYCLISPNFTNEMKYLSTGTSNSHQRINPKDIKDYDLFLPTDEEIQKKIGYILKLLDKKISMNVEINKNLEELAKAIYRHHFIDFKPYALGGLMKHSSQGMIPKDWSVQSIEEFVDDMKNGGTPKRGESDYWDNGTVPWLKTGEINNNIIIKSEEHITELGLKNSSAKLLPINSIIMALYGKGTAARIGLLKFEATTNQACCAMICNDFNKTLFLYLFLLFNQKEIENLASGSVQQNLSKDLIANLELVVPPIEIIDNLPFKEIFDTIANNYFEIEYLINLRDTLLPKLMSGEIDVSKINCDLELKYNYMKYLFNQIHKQLSKSVV